MALVLNMLLLAQEDNTACMASDSEPTAGLPTNLLTALVKAWPPDLVVEAARKTLHQAEKVGAELNLPADEQVWCRYLPLSANPLCNKLTVPGGAMYGI
jgi:hypothetical protein